MLDKGNIIKFVNADIVECAFYGCQFVLAHGIQLFLAIVIRYVLTYSYPVVFIAYVLMHTVAEYIGIQSCIKTPFIVYSV